MSQNLNNNSAFENSQKNNPASQAANYSLSIFNKISSISLRNITKFSSVNSNEFSFLKDSKKEIAPIEIEDFPLKYSKTNEENIEKNDFPMEIEDDIIEKQNNLPYKENEVLENFNNNGFSRQEKINHQAKEAKEFTVEIQEFPLNHSFSNPKNENYQDKRKNNKWNNVSMDINTSKNINNDELNESKRHIVDISDSLMKKNKVFDKSENYDFLIKDWDDYFHDEAPSKIKIEDDYRHIIIRTVYHLYSNPEFVSLLQWGNEKYYGVIDCFIDFQKLKLISSASLNSINISSNYNKFEIDLLQILNEILDNFGSLSSDILHSFDLALDAIRVKILKKVKRKVITRFYNFPSITSLPEIRSNLIGFYISIKGIVLKTSPVKLLAKSMKFFCFECHKSFEKKFEDGIYKLPSMCANFPKCRSKMFQPDKSKAQTILYQRVKLQEIDEDSASGRVPRNLDCELKENLANCVISGDTVIFNGILKTEALDDNKNGGGKRNQQGLFNMYMDVNSIINCKNKTKFISNKNQTSDDEDLTEFDIKTFESLMPLAKDRTLFPFLIKSFCPSIYGHEIVKAGLLLAIVGGSLDVSQQKSKVISNNFNKKEASFRTDCHVLLIGDPGLGKSQLLKYVANISPRSVYVCGKSSSTVGLTVSVQKDSNSGEGSLEAGALVLSDQGVCCIDEFDKMEKEHLALLESMEQQTVSIAKSGVLCSLQTRTTIIASANPASGSYNKQKNIKENIKISNAILSRFDLIFLMLDEPDPKRDQKLSEHVMRLHNTRKRKREDFEANSFNPQNVQNSEIFSQINMNFNEYVFAKSNINANARRSFEDKPNNFESFYGCRYLPLSERLNKSCENINKTLPTNVFKKYIAYVKKNIHPYLSSEASYVLRDFYMRLRENNDPSSSIAITTRQLESLIRLAQARAKIESRTEVTKEDAIEVVELMQESLFDALEDFSCKQSNKIEKIGQKSLKNFTNIGSLSVPKQTKIFIEKLNEEAANKNSDLFEYQDLLRIAKSLNMSLGSDFAGYIDKLNYENYLIMKNSKLYQLARLKQF